MSATSTVNTSLNNLPNSSTIALSKAERIAICAAFMLISVFVVVGNLFAIVLFVTNKKLRKKRFFLVINMAFADLMLGAVSLPIYIYMIGLGYKIWTGRLPLALDIFFVGADAILVHASLLSAAFVSCERCYATYWPFKHRILSLRAYRILIFMVWIIAVLVSTVVTVLWFLTSVKSGMYAWLPFPLTLTVAICSCNIAIWTKFQHGSVAPQQHNRAALNKRLTKTLLFVSVLALLWWLPLTIMKVLQNICHVSIPWKVYAMAKILNYASSFVNPIVYTLKIPEFRQAAVSLCRIRRKEALNKELVTRRKNANAAFTPPAQPRTVPTDPGHVHLAFEQEVVDTRL